MNRRPACPRHLPPSRRAYNRIVDHNVELKLITKHQLIELPNVTTAAVFTIAFHRLWICHRVIWNLFKYTTDSYVWAFVNDCVFLGLVPRWRLFSIIFTRTATSWLVVQLHVNEWRTPLAISFWTIQLASVDCKCTTPVLRLFSRSLRRSLCNLPLLTKFGLYTRNSG